MREDLDLSRPRPPKVKPILAGALLASIVAIAACGTGDEERATERQDARGPTIENHLGPQGYRDVVSESLALLEAYWTEELAAEDEDSRPPSRLVSFWNRNQDPGCGGTPLGPYNAQYCSLSDTILWDGNWLLGDLYLKAGDAAVAFLLAHEYGHLVQNRLGAERGFEFTIEAEINADCLAGAWFGAVDERVAELTGEDYRALYGGVLDVADPAGLPWQDPEAHGTAGQRGTALLFGGRNGARACFRRFGPGFTR